MRTRGTCMAMKTVIWVMRISVCTFIETETTTTMTPPRHITKRHNKTTCESNYLGKLKAPLDQDLYCRTHRIYESSTGYELLNHGYEPHPHRNDNTKHAINECT